MKVGSLFAGIGGFELGLERAGMEVAWSCDIEPFAQHILKKHWPHAPVYGDITQLKGADVEPVDVLCGGFPCQDISLAGKGAGIEEGTRSGLWSEYARLVGELRPRYVIVENVAALRRRGLDRVLRDLSLLGYDAEWDRIRASDVGALHQRARLWIVAYPNGSGESACTQHAEACWVPHATGRPDASELADPDTTGRPNIEGSTRPPESSGRRVFVSDHAFGGPFDWLPEPDVGRVADGVPDTVDRLRSLGNALVPQIAEWIGTRILAYELANQEGGG